jgi:hypothetical protein
VPANPSARRRRPELLLRGVADLQREVQRRVGALLQKGAISVVNDLARVFRYAGRASSDQTIDSPDDSRNMGAHDRPVPIGPDAA